MKERLKKIIRLLLLGTAILLMALLVLGAVLAMEWPLWVALFLLLLLAGCALGWLFFRKLWFRSRERSFVGDVMVEAAHPEQAGVQDRNELKELQLRWKQGMDALCNSRLKKHGNPLYVLPWYLMIGESGSSKTTSIQAATATSPFQQTGALAGGVPTRTCEWWFLEQAVVIDTAGRYAVPVDEESDKQEWRHFLRLLAKYRRREPLNGVVVTVAADRLLSEKGEVLAEEGRTIRRRIDEMMRVLGVSFPVYVLVTKCDLIHGMNEFVAPLPEKSLQQAMGVINRGKGGDVAAFVAEALTTTSERLRELRLQLLLEQQATEIEPGDFLFPEEFAHLKSGLDSFMGPAFGSNHYQETPVLQGLFFSSGEQQGSARSKFASHLAAPAGEEQPAPTAGKRGVFLHDLFAKILPQDRYLFAPTRRTVEWQQITGNLGLLCWIVVGIAICGLLSYSFVKNLSTIREFPHHFAAPAATGGGYGELASIDRYRVSILTVQERNRHWWLPRFGLNASLTVEQELKRRFCKTFHDGFLNTLDRRLAGEMGAFQPTVADAVYGEYVVHLARRINLLEAARQGEHDGELKKMPQPNFIDPLATVPSGGSDETKARFTAAYLCYLSWGYHSGEIDREVAFCRGWLQHLVALKGGDLRWVAGWVDRHGAAAPVTLADFWGGSRPAAGETTVAASFTAKGKRQIDALLEEVDAALADKKLSPARRAEFDSWYHCAALGSWEAFVAGFPRGSERLRGEREWREAAAKMVSEQNPYLALLNRLVGEQAGSPTAPELPRWLQQVHQLHTFTEEGTLAGSEAATKAADGGKKLLVTLEKKIGRQAGAQQIDDRLAGSRAYREYRAALAAIAPATVSRGQAYQAAFQLYGEDPAISKSPFVAAFNATRQLQAALAAGSSKGELTGQLLAGPVGFLWNFVRQEAAGHLQSQWEEQVVAGTLGMDAQQATPLLLGPEGLVWKFVKGPAAPFLSRSVRGFHPKEVLGGSVQFDPGFLAFLERGSQLQAATMSRQPSYSVGIEGLPTDANRDARVKPHATRLELQCGVSTQTLVNLNYPTGKTFNWSPDSCGDVVLQIEAGDQTLTHRYLGPQAFPEFLRSFAGGHRTFTPRDFPGERKALLSMGIRHIKVNYQFIGSGPVIKQTSAVCSQLPKSIAKCWTN